MLPCSHPHRMNCSRHLARHPGVGAALHGLKVRGRIQLPGSVLASYLKGSPADTFGRNVQGFVVFYSFNAVQSCSGTATMV